MAFVELLGHVLKGEMTESQISDSIDASNIVFNYKGTVGLFYLHKGVGLWLGDGEGKIFSTPMENKMVRVVRENFRSREGVAVFWVGAGFGGAF